MTRAEKIAYWMLENKGTIRSAGEKFGIGKNVVHAELHKNLAIDNIELYRKIEDLLANNFNTKHIRGGIANRKKYKKIQAI